MSNFLQHLIFLAFMMLISKLTIVIASTSARCPDGSLPVSDALLLEVLVSYANKSISPSAASSYSSSSSTFQIDSAVAAGVELVESVPAFVRSAPSVVLRTGIITSSAAVLEFSTRSQLRFLNLSLYNISFDVISSSSSTSSLGEGAAACGSAASRTGSGSWGPMVRQLVLPTIKTLPSHVILSPVAAGKSHLVCAVADFAPGEESGYEVLVRRAINCTRFDTPLAAPASSNVSFGAVLLYNLLALAVLLGLLLVVAAIVLRQQCTRERLKDVQLPALLQKRCSCACMWLGFRSPAALTEERVSSQKKTNTEEHKRVNDNDKNLTINQQLRKEEAQSDTDGLQRNPDCKLAQPASTQRATLQEQYVQLLIHSEVTDFTTQRFSSLSGRPTTTKNGNKRHSALVAAMSPQKPSRRHHNRRANTTVAGTDNRPQTVRDKSPAEGKMPTTPLSPMFPNDAPNNKESPNLKDSSKRNSSSPHSVINTHQFASRVSHGNCHSNTQPYASPNTPSSQTKAQWPPTSNQNHSPRQQSQSPRSVCKLAGDPTHGHNKDVRCAVDAVISGGTNSTAVLSSEMSGPLDEWTMETTIKEATGRLSPPFASAAVEEREEASGNPEDPSRQVAMEVEEQPFSVCLVMPQSPDKVPKLDNKRSTLHNPLDSNLQAAETTDGKAQADVSVNESGPLSAAVPNSGSETATAIHQLTTSSTSAVTTPANTRTHPYERRLEINRGRDTEWNADCDSPQTNSHSNVRPRHYHHQQQRRHTDASVVMATITMARITNAATQTGRGRLSTGPASGPETAGPTGPIARHLMANASGTSFVQRPVQPRLGLLSGQVGRQSLTMASPSGLNTQAARPLASEHLGTSGQHYIHLPNGDPDDVWVMRTSHL